jgi:hypothetical protein
MEYIIPCIATNGNTLEKDDPTTDHETIFYLYGLIIRLYILLFVI